MQLINAICLTDIGQQFPFVLQKCSVMAPFCYRLWTPQIYVYCVTMVLSEQRGFEHDFWVITTELYIHRRWRAEKKGEKTRMRIADNVSRTIRFEYGA